MEPIVEEEKKQSEVDIKDEYGDEQTEDDEKIAKMKQAVQNKQIVLKEFILDNDMEAINISKMYFKQINKVLDPAKKEKKKVAEASESETDDDGEMVENMYINENYGQGKNDEKHAQNMLKAF